MKKGAIEKQKKNKNSVISRKYEVNYINDVLEVKWDQAEFGTQQRAVSVG